MGLIFKLIETNFSNDYYVYYKESLTLGDENKGFVKYGDLNDKNNDIIILSGITINFDSNYWIKLVDSVTNEYVIKEIIIREKKIIKEVKNIKFYEKIIIFFKNLCKTIYNTIYIKRK